MVDGSWYHVDVTFDDSVPAPPNHGRARRQDVVRDNLLISDETTRGIGHPKWARDVGAFVASKPTPMTPAKDYHADVDDRGFWHGASAS